MTLPLILCTLIALTSGLQFGKEFAEAHGKHGNMLIPVLAHMAISVTLITVSVLLDTTPGNMMWMIVATASMGGLALGALVPLHLPARVNERQPQQTETQAPAQTA